MTLFHTCKAGVIASTIMLLYTHRWVTATPDACTCAESDEPNRDDFASSAWAQSWVSRVRILSNDRNASGSDSSVNEIFTCPEGRSCYTAEHIQVFKHPVDDGRQLQLAQKCHIMIVEGAGKCGMPRLEVGKEYLLRGAVESNKGSASEHSTSPADRLSIYFCGQLGKEHELEWANVPEKTKTKLTKIALASSA